MVTSVATDRDTAEATCVASGGHLATITSSAQNSALVSAFSAQVTSSPCIYGDNCFWIGYKRVYSGGAFAWTDNSTSTYTNWGSTLDNCGGCEACTHVRTSGSWNDVACSLSTDTCGDGKLGSYQGLCKRSGNMLCMCH